MTAETDHLEPDDTGAPPLGTVGSRLLCLVDHANVDFPRVGIGDVLHCWLPHILNRVSGVPLVVLRAYGGWFDDENMHSPGRDSAAAFYQLNCPSLLRVSGTLVRVKFEFADSLLSLRSTGPRCDIAVRRTVVKRAGFNIPQERGKKICAEEHCELPRVRRWARRRRACTREACPHGFSDHFDRFEQKQVDTHLAVDALLALVDQGVDSHLAILSDDADILPVVAACGIVIRAGSSLTVVRITRQASYMDNDLRSLGANICQVVVR